MDDLEIDVCNILTRLQFTVQFTPSDKRQVRKLRVALEEV